MNIQEETKKIIEKYPRSFKEVSINDLLPNSWNPNHQSELVYKSVKASIEKHGLLQFPVVRAYVGQYQIIDGEHKWKICKELGHKTISALVLGDDTIEVSDDDAMALTELLNTRGQNDPIKFAKMLRELDKMNPAQTPLFAYTEKEKENLKALVDFDFSVYEKEIKVEIKRERMLAFQLSNQEYDVVRHALTLTKRPQTEGLMFLVKEFLELRGETIKFEAKKQGEEVCVCGHEEGFHEPFPENESEKFCTVIVDELNNVCKCAKYQTLVEKSNEEIAKQDE